MKKIIISFALFLSFTTLFSQVQIDSVYTYKKLNKSLSFAQMTMGGDVLGLTGGTILQGDKTQSFGLTTQPRFTIGGMHFWGHADFYVTFPLGLRLQGKNDFSNKFKNIEGVETGLKIYPIALRPGRVSPYIGISFQPYQFGYQAVGKDYKEGYAKQENFITPVQLGLTYTTKKLLITAGMRYNWKTKFNYYESPTQIREVNINPVNFSIGILRYFDTDKGIGSPKQIKQENIKYYLLKKNNKLSTWYYGVGPSSALQMSKSPFFEKKYPFLHNDMLNSFLLPDVTFGRFFSKIDMNIGLAARSMFFKTGAFDTNIKMNRNVLSLEAYKFLFDYHGFVPFVGPMFSLENLNVNVNGIKTNETKPALGVIFGWDIRVTKTGTSLLRTNLRYTPNLNLKIEGEKVMFDHLEFNFIQWVHFFGRGKVYQAHSDKK
jgi:hypothetical protein